MEGPVRKHQWKWWTRRLLKMLMRMLSIQSCLTLGNFMGQVSPLLPILQDFFWGFFFSRQSNTLLSPECFQGSNSGVFQNLEKSKSGPSSWPAQNLPALSLSLLGRKTGRGSDNEQAGVDSNIQALVTSSLRPGAAGHGGGRWAGSSREQKGELAPGEVVKGPIWDLRLAVADISLLLQAEIGSQEVAESGLLRNKLAFLGCMLGGPLETIGCSLWGRWIWRRRDLCLLLCTEQVREKRKLVEWRARSGW